MVLLPPRAHHVLAAVVKCISECANSLLSSLTTTITSHAPKKTSRHCRQVSCLTLFASILPLSPQPPISPFRTNPLLALYNSIKVPEIIPKQESCLARHDHTKRREYAVNFPKDSALVAMVGSSRKEDCVQQMGFSACHC